MVDSEDEFTQLCSKLLKRVKKTRPPDSRDVPKSSTAAKTKFKKPKPSATKSQAGNEDTKRDDQGITSGSDHEKSAEQNELSDCDGASSKTRGLQTQDHPSNVNTQRASSARAGTEPPKLQDQPSVTHMVLERMQQFKRAVPSRMKSSTAEDGDPVALSSVADLPESDVALPMDLNQQHRSLEDQGLFFCQLCQKDLTTMNSALREQHVNRCLDQDESLGRVSDLPSVPSCPLCGKPFSTEKSRASHLKRCAAKLEVPAQTLLQAVQRQNNKTCPEVTAGLSRAKRKAGSRQKEPPKKRKLAQLGSEVEELLVAMALSRSMQEDTAAASIASGTGPEPAREVTVPVKKSRRKQKDRPPPLLLVQDPQAPMQRLQERMSLLLGEESEAITIGKLPPSHFWDMEENQKAAWLRPQREGKRGVLWEISNLVENVELLNYYTKELNPFVIPWKPPPKLLNSQPRTMTRSLPSSPCAVNGTKEEPSHGIPCRASPHLSSSQKDRQALLDLAELAEEGMTLTQWNAGSTRAINNTGRDSVGSLPSSGFVPTLHEESIVPSRHLQPDAPLVHLATDFMEMVNNPHLSDAQLQTDCGEVLNVHMFVLYARCPLLVEAVHSEGFWVDEAGTGRIQRYLLNDVSAEAALSFLRFLYSARSGIPAHCLAHVCELARRFGVTSLIEACERLVDDPQYAGTQGVAEEDEDDGEERAETFQGLLKSMWVDEGEVVADSLPEDGSEEEKADVEGVGEGELEEIYEFAATQRRMMEDVCGGGVGGSSSSEHDAGQLRMESDDCPLEVAVQTAPANGQHRYREISAQLTAPPAASDGLMPVNTSPVCLTSHRIETSPAKIPLSTPVSTIRMSAPAAQTCHPAVSVSRQLFGKPASRNKSEHGQCARYSPSPLDDTYDQMFSETCGEYAESSAISATSANVKVMPPGDRKRPRKTLASLPLLGRSPNLLPLPPNPQPLNKTVQKSPTNSHPRCRISASSPPTSLSPSPHFLVSPKSMQRTTPKSVASSPVSRSPIQRFLASPDGIQPPTPKSVASSPVSRSPIQRFPASPDGIQSPTPKSVASSPVSRSPIHRFLASPDSIQPLTPKSVASPSRFLASPNSVQPTTPKSVTSPVYSQPCSLPSGSFLSSSPQFQNSPLLASPRNSLSSLASAPNSQPQSLPSLASPSKSRPASLISTDSSPGKQRSLKSPSNSQHCTPSPSNRSPTRPNTSSPNTKTDEQGVILILSSDEESTPTANAREALRTQRTCDTGACGGVKESPMSFLERRSNEGLGRLEMSSSTDTSWLIPATPLCHATAAHTSQNQPSHQPLQRPNSSKVALHDLSVSPSQAMSPISPPKSTPKSPGDRTTSKISLSVRNTPGERKTHSSFGSKGSHVPSSLPTSPASSSVFEVGDSDDDAPGSETQPDPINHSFYMDYEPPIHMEDEMWLDREETPQRPTFIPEEKTPSPKKNSPGTIKPLLEVSPEESLHAAASQSRSQSFLNPRLWDKWEEDDGDDDLPATLPLFERLNKIPDNRTKLKTPVSLVRKRELPPEVPITPLPSYSDMDTPILKKELNRFGVRALPKKQMVLKLKEIFQYTHQVMSSGSDDEVPSSQQVQKQKHSSTSQPPRPARKEMPTGGGKVQNGPQAKRAKKLASVCSVQEADEQPLTASQESTASSAAASDTSSLSQSSGGNEFETAFAEEDEEEPCAPSQEAGRQVATAEAVRRFIEEHPELHKRILMYQPLDLAAVQVELKQSGIKMAAGKLLDFLDAHCVTFTTAATRREKKIPRRRKGGKRY